MIYFVFQLCSVCIFKTCLETQSKTNTVFNLYLQFCLKPAPNCTASSLCMSSWEYTWEYITLMGMNTFGMSLGNTVGTHLNLWDTLGIHLEYTWNTLGTHFFRDIPVFLDLGLRWPRWTGNTVGIQVWITGRISGFEEHTWDISFWENGCFLYLRDIHTEHGLEKSLSGIHLEVPFEHINSIHLEHKKIILDISNVWLLWVVVKVASDALILLWYPCFGSSCCGLCRWVCGVGWTRWWQAGWSPEGLLRGQWCFECVIAPLFWKQPLQSLLLSMWWRSQLLLRSPMKTARAAGIACSDACVCWRLTVWLGVAGVVHWCEWRLVSPQCGEGADLCGLYLPVFYMWLWFFRRKFFRSLDVLVGLCNLVGQFDAATKWLSLFI